jgi:hypothetical protein
MDVPSGSAARFSGEGDTLSVTIPDSLLLPSQNGEITVEWAMRPLSLPNPSGSATYFLDLSQSYDTHFVMRTNGWANPHFPTIRMHGEEITDNTTMAANYGPHWLRVKLVQDAAGVVKTYVNDSLISETVKPPNGGRENDWQLTLGNFDGYIDELRISIAARDGTAAQLAASDTAASLGLNKGFDDWLASTTGTSSVLTTRNLMMDPDADGLALLLEYATGGQATLADLPHEHTPHVMVEHRPGGPVLTLRYRRLTNGQEFHAARYLRGDLLYVIETATDLGPEPNWTVEHDSWKHASEPTDAGDGTEWVTLERPWTPESPQFARLRVYWILQD